MPKPKKCRICKNDFEPSNSTHIVCSYKCAMAFAQEKSYAKAKKFSDSLLEDSKSSKIRIKKLKISIRSLKDYESDAKKSFQKWARLRDKDLPCISCDKFTKLNDGGHYKKAEVYSGLIFNEYNVNLQCRKCNRFLNGNELNYRIGLIKKIGEDKVLELEELANESRLYKFTKDELIDIKSKYDKLIKLKS
jgi:hypothetical protein